MLPYDELGRDAVLASLADRRVRPLVAVTPSDVEGLVHVAARARAHRLSFGIWPMLDEADGRWLHPTNAPHFRRHLNRVLVALDRIEAPPAEVAFDLEPPIDRVRDAVHGSPTAFRARSDVEREGRQELEAMLGDARQRDAATLAVVPPMILWDPLPRRRSKIPCGGWQAWVGFSVDSEDFDQISVMFYTSLFEGYISLMRRPDVRWLLDRGCRRARLRWGERASMSLGLSGVGALGDEQPYRDASELADDVAITRRHGIHDVALHGLAGARSRGGMDTWLEILTRTQPARGAPAPSSRGVALAIAMHGLSFPLALCMRGRNLPRLRRSDARRGT